jgi:arylsulfatase A-like enzyme
MLDALDQLHHLQLDQQADPQLETRISQYELAFKMQSSIPEVVDVADESKETLDLYGPDVNKPGSYAANCLLARRLAERGVRYIQLYHPGWDQHGGLPGGLRNQCRETDQASAALVKDLKQRGMLEDTLVVWAGEFGRTNYCQGQLNGNQFGRDHHPRCYSMWMAGGGTKPGTSYGKTDEYGYNIAENRVHVHDLQATILHLLGIDHERLTYRHQGRRYRLTDVHGEVVKPIIV